MRNKLYKILIVWCLIAFHVPQIWFMYFLVVPKTGNGGFADAFFNAFLLIGWGGIHSLLARKPSKRVISKLVGDDFVKVVYISIAGFTQCAVLYYYRPLQGILWQTEGVFYIALLILFFICMAAVFLFSVQLDYMEVLGIRTILNRLNHVKNENIETELCLKGGYRYCRHPVYTATILLLWTGPVMTVTRFELAFFWTIYVLIGTWLEDQDTINDFGEAYTEYKKHVPMLIPRFSPWRG